jgi:site-specific DNA-methyltransferase (adenine-specific)
LTEFELPTDENPVVIIQGDCLDVLPRLPAGCVDAVVTDPPYSSGGAFRSDRTNSTVSKYVQSGQQAYRAEFGGDSRDQRGFLAWSSLWLTASLRLTKPGGSLVSFIDWRQLPVLTDAVQSGGWTWRNIGTWWKPGVRMQRGRFSGSAEYIVYATAGPNDSDGERSPQNVFSCQPVGGEGKEHIAEKPVDVVSWAMSVTPAGSMILDPFAGSGTTAVAAILEGRKAILIEKDLKYVDIARRRVAEALCRPVTLSTGKVAGVNLFASAV